MGITPKSFALIIHDLSVDEPRRRSAILDAIGDDWDSIRALAQEMQAHEQRYLNLNPSSSGSTTNWSAPGCFRIGQ